jgi:uncharacterized LabA/DUF88 family protein
VDFYNVRRGFRTRKDCADCLQAIIGSLIEVLKDRRPCIDELELRLYGGWRGSDQRPTRDAEWVLSAVEAARTRISGIRVLPRMVTALAVHPSHELVGTLRRPGDEGMGEKARQKMVDTMMTADAVFMARSPVFELAIWSDDDDLLPAVLSVARYAADGDVLWIRERPRGRAMNDGQLPPSVSIISVNLEEGVL